MQLQVLQTYVAKYFIHAKDNRISISDLWSFQSIIRNENQRGMLDFQIGYIKKETEMNNETDRDEQK